MLRGTFQFLQPTHDLVVTSPAFFLRKPNSPYTLNTGIEGEPSEELYALFTPADHWQPLLRWPFNPEGIAVIEVVDEELRREVIKCLHEALQIWIAQPHRHSELASNLLERALLLLDGVNPEQQHHHRDSRIFKAIDYMRRHYRQEINITSLSRHVGLSPSRFAHLFRSQMNVTPKQQLELIRLDVAAEKLLVTMNPVEEIGFSVGFTNPAHFSTRFKKRFNHSPRHYRAFHLRS